MQNAPITAPASPPTRLLLLHGLADRAEGVVRMAHALVKGGRIVDLAGLDHTIGQLCAGCLDVGPDDGRTLRPRLAALLAEMDRLTASLRQPDAPT